MKIYDNEYNKAVEAWDKYKKAKNYTDKSSDSNPVVDTFLDDYSIIKWSKMIKRDKLRKIKYGNFDENEICYSLYRPYSKQYIYFGYIPLDVIGKQREIFPTGIEDNIVISFNGNNNKEWNAISFKYLVDLNALYGGSRCVPLYTYDKSGNRLDNITDWGLQQFQNHYSDQNITKENIFHYAYAVLHNPEYFTKYELNLKRDFPRIPFYEDFAKWSAWGKHLMDLHINYETVEPSELKEITTDIIEKPKPKLKADKETGSIALDDVTILNGIPKEAWQYKIGNRSALEWILDQYKEKKPTDPTIAEKFNTYRFADYKPKVIDLLKRVCTVSVETMKIITEMSEK